MKSHWGEIVGANSARRTEPVRVSAPRGGAPATLEIRVEGPSATLVQHQAPEILARVNLYLGAGAVERLRIVQGPLRRLARKARAVKIRPRGPLDAAAERDLALSLASFEDGPLKTALEKLGREVMRDLPRDRRDG